MLPLTLGRTAPNEIVAQIKKIFSHISFMVRVVIDKLINSSNSRYNFDFCDRGKVVEKKFFFKSIFAH